MVRPEQRFAAHGRHFKVDVIAVAVQFGVDRCALVASRDGDSPGGVVRGALQMKLKTEPT